MVNRARILLLVGILTSALAVVPAQPRLAQEARLEGLDDYIVQAMRAWEVPGLALALVTRERVLLAKGYGVKRLGDPALVTEHTLFAIGSASKAFTAAALAMLVDEGKVHWDDPVLKYLPEFQLWDPYVTRELTIRDLLAHRSGLDRADLVWYGATLERAEILRRMRSLPPRWSFRSRFGYQNIMYVAAGEVVRAVTGKSWEEFVRERIFQPLGMSSTTTSVKALSAASDVATPHARIEGVVRPIPWREIDAMAPAGSINSSVWEMARWIQLQLGEGEYQGRRLWSVEVAREMHAPQTILRREPPFADLFPEAHFLTYGLGWFLHDYRGRKIVEHGGNIDGMTALVVLVPEEHFGFVILTNMNQTLLTHALKYRILDAYFTAPPRDWSAEFLKTAQRLQEQQQALWKKIEEARVKGTAPSVPQAQYAGIYENEVYGTIQVAEEGGRLVLRWGSARVGDLEHWHYDTFRVRWRDPMLPQALVTFSLNAEGDVERVSARFLGFPEPISFARRPRATGR